MKASQFFEQTRQLPIATRSDLTRDAPFVVLSPHPDDETLGAGGLIKMACAAGQRVDVLVLTDGAGSHTHSIKYPTQRLIDVRKTEVLEAAKILGLPAPQIRHIDLPDANAPMEGPTFDEAVAEIVRAISGHGAKTLFVTWEGDPHCDHQAAANMARAAIRQRPDVTLLAYPIWGWHLDGNLQLSTAPRGYRLDISNEMEAKREAILAHRSQMTDLIDDDPNGFRFTEQTLAPFLVPYEYFYTCDAADLFVACL